MTVIVDYGVGNLRSVQKACEFVGGQALVTDDLETIRRAARVILPGVGAFAPAMARIRKTGLASLLAESVGRGVPLLGICLGMQLLFEESLEDGCHEGLGLLPGRVERFPSTALKVPHVGWNTVENRGGRLFQGLPHTYYAYFVHSYRVPGTASPFVSGITDYVMPFCSAVAHENVFGTQFHPEKSGQAGLMILKQFLEV